MTSYHLVLTVSLYCIILSYSFNLLLLCSSRLGGAEGCSISVYIHTPNHLNAWSAVPSKSVEIDEYDLHSEEGSCLMLDVSDTSLSYNEAWLYCSFFGQPLIDGTVILVFQQKSNLSNQSDRSNLSHQSLFPSSCAPKPFIHRTLVSECLFGEPKQTERELNFHSILSGHQPR